MNKRHIFLTLLLAALALVPVVNLYQVLFIPPKAKAILLVPPYVQIGNHPDHTAVSVLWQTADIDRDWSLQFNTNDKDWTQSTDISFKRALPELIEPSRLYCATLTGLTPGQSFQYRLLDNQKLVFSGASKTPSTNQSNYKFVVFGDAGFGSPAQKKIAYRTYVSKPDFIVITGDIVYQHGRLSEYREKFFPVYNCDQASLSTGAPLLRSIPMIPAPGNHDIDLAHATLARNLEFYPDGMAYFAVWDLPLNGPIKNPGSPNTPVLIGSPKRQSAFMSEAGSKYPVMANYSFDWGNSHWLILDANNYMNWADPSLRAWVEQDLKKAAKSTWRFVAYHQPGFNSDSKHFYDQRMRLLANLFEKYNVDVAFGGHVHNYQRTYPLRFTVEKNLTKVLPSPFNGTVAGATLCDHTFPDKGNKIVKPKGVIYVITGGGGANLTGTVMATNPKRWQNFTKVFVANTHSFTNCEISGRHLMVKQISEDGLELDSFVINK